AGETHPRIRWGLLLLLHKQVGGCNDLVLVFFNEMIFLLLFVTQVFVILALIAGVLAAPQSNPNDITIVNQEEVNNIGVGGYHFSYEQSDGQKREETAELKNEGTENESLSVVGSFSFIAPDGHTYRYAISKKPP
ncbi:CU12 protein, partial [Acromyrmex insinuator]